jgi:hypothetical protein
VGLFSRLFGEITIKTCGNKVGYLFNNSMFNVSTSGVGTGVTGFCCIKSLAKGIASPLPWCKGLYFASSTLSGVSFVLNGVCLISGYSSVAKLPLLTGTLGYVTSVGARACNNLADCMNPADYTTNKAVESCLDFVLEKLA